MYDYKIKNVIKVVDGDTIDVDIDLGMNTIKANERIRLAGIDTPESRTNDKFEKSLGIESKEYLKSKLKEAKKIIIKTELPDSTEKYGRMLGWLYLDEDTVSLNDHMIEEGYAWPYMGATKVKDFAALAKQRELAKKKVK